MNRTMIGLLFILAGVAYGSLVIDDIYNHTLGWLVANDWISQETVKKAEKASPFGRKPTIVFYSLLLIIVGIYMLWNRNI